jgi:hypothetical protein
MKFKEDTYIFSKTAIKQQNRLSFIVERYFGRIALPIFANRRTYNIHSRFTLHGYSPFFQFVVLVD